MIIKSDIIHKPQIKNLFSGSVKTRTVGFVSDAIPDSSPMTSELLNLIKKIKIILKKKTFLNSKSDVRAFFGLDSYEKMSQEKTEALLTYFKNFEFGDKLFNAENFQTCSISDSKGLINLFKNLKPDFGCAKITFNDKCFRGVFHTLGFVRNKGILYVLDSLGHNKNVDSHILKFHKKLKEVLSACKKEANLEKIVLNQNTQQSVEEITCNHWTYANIEALINSLKKGKTIRTKEELDGVLPRNINRVLEEQKDFVIDRYIRFSL